MRGSRRSKRQRANGFSDSDPAAYKSSGWVRLLRRGIAFIAMSAVAFTASVAPTFPATAALACTSGDCAQQPSAEPSHPVDVGGPLGVTATADGWLHYSHTLASLVADAKTTLVQARSAMMARAVGKAQQ